MHDSHYSYIYAVWKGIQTHYHFDKTRPTRPLPCFTFIKVLVFLIISIALFVFFFFAEISITICICICIFIYISFIYLFLIFYYRIITFSDIIFEQIDFLGFIEDYSNNNPNSTTSSTLSHYSRWMRVNEWGKNGRYI